MKKKLLILMLIFVVACSFTACGSDEPATDETQETESSEQTEPEVTEEETVTEPAEGFDILGGEVWEVRALIDDEHGLITFDEVPEIASMYDATFLSFDRDGKFSYIDKFPATGTYTFLKKDEKFDYYFLKTEKSYKWDHEKDKFVEGESGPSSNYIVTVVNSTTIMFSRIDAETSELKDEFTLVFVKPNEEDPVSEGNDSSGGDSSYSSGSDDSNREVPSDSSYEAIYDEYVQKMEDAVPGLVAEYKSEASGISDISRLAEICNDKIGELAKISNEGIGKMAELMYKKGDSQSTYESWANKLMDKYTEIAEEITDAYMDSAIG